MIAKIMAAVLGIGQLVSGAFKFATMFMTFRWLTARRDAKEAKEQRDKVLSREKTDADIKSMPVSDRRSKLREWSR